MPRKIKKRTPKAPPNEDAEINMVVAIEARIGDLGASVQCDSDPSGTAKTPVLAEGQTEGNEVLLGLEAVVDSNEISGAFAMRIVDELISILAKRQAKKMAIRKSRETELVEKDLLPTLRKLSKP